MPCNWLLGINISEQPAASPFTAHHSSVLKMVVDYSWNVMARGDTREGKWRGNWRMEWVASTLHTTSEHGVSSITTADAHTSAASSRLNWRPRRFKWSPPFRRKTKSGFWACAITFQTHYTTGCEGLLVYDLETSTMRPPTPDMGCWATEKHTVFLKRKTFVIKNFNRSDKVIKEMS